MQFALGLCLELCLCAKCPEREGEKYNYLVTALLTQGRATLTSHSLSVLLTNCPGLLLPHPNWEVTQSSTSSFPFHPTSFFSALFLLKNYLLCLKKML